MALDEAQERSYEQKFQQVIGAYRDGDRETIRR